VIVPLLRLLTSGFDKATLILYYKVTVVQRSNGRFRERRRRCGQIKSPSESTIGLEMSDMLYTTMNEPAIQKE
jgi:hypothetical protein